MTDKTDKTDMTQGQVTTELVGRVLVIRIDRPQKLNGFTVKMIRELYGKHYRDSIRETDNTAASFQAALWELAFFVNYMKKYHDFVTTDTFQCVGGLTSKSVRKILFKNSTCPNGPQKFTQWSFAYRIAP